MSKGISYMIEKLFSVRWFRTSTNFGQNQSQTTNPIFCCVLGCVFFLRLCHHLPSLECGFLPMFFAQILTEQKHYPKNFPRTLKKRQGGFLTIRNGSVNGVCWGVWLWRCRGRKKTCGKSGILSAFAASICPKKFSLWIEMESANSILIALRKRKNIPSSRNLYCMARQPTTLTSYPLPRNKGLY